MRVQFKRTSYGQLIVGLDLMSYVPFTGQLK